MTDRQMRQAILDEIDLVPGLRSTEIRVRVREGVATLSGTVDTYARKFDAERAAHRILGVRQVITEVEVVLSPESRRPDGEIARAAEGALAVHPLVPAERITATVLDAVIILDGEVDRREESAAAEYAVRGLIGVRDLRCQVSVRAGAVDGALQTGRRTR